MRKIKLIFELLGLIFLFPLVSYGENCLQYGFNLSKLWNCLRSDISLYQTPAKINNSAHEPEACKSIAEPSEKFICSIEKNLTIKDSLKKDLSLFSIINRESKNGVNGAPQVDFDSGEIRCLLKNSVGCGSIATSFDTKKLFLEQGVTFLLDLNSGVAENFTVREHTTSALQMLEVQRPYFEHIHKNLTNARPYNHEFLKTLVAVHDIGKGWGALYRSGNVYEIPFTYPIAWNIFRNLRTNAGKLAFTDWESYFGILLIHLHKLIGSYVKNNGKMGINLFKEEISNQVNLLNRYKDNVDSSSKISVEEFFHYLLYLYYADTLAYPYLKSLLYKQFEFKDKDTVKNIFILNESTEVTVLLSYYNALFK